MKTVRERTYEMGLRTSTQTGREMYGTLKLITSREIEVDIMYPTAFNTGSCYAIEKYCDTPWLMIYPDLLHTMMQTGDIVDHNDLRRKYHTYIPVLHSIDRDMENLSHGFIRKLGTCVLFRTKPTLSYIYPEMEKFSKWNLKMFLRSLVSWRLW